MTYLALGDTQQALNYLVDFRKRRPGQGNVDQLIEAIRQGKLGIHRTPG
jgi:hypothetical protein